MWGVTRNENYAFYLLSILNANSFVGLVVPSFRAGIVGPMIMLVLCTFAGGTLCLCWIGIENVVGITVFAILNGFFAEAYVSLIIPAIVELTLDTNESVCGSFWTTGRESNRRVACGCPAEAVCRSTGICRCSDTVRSTIDADGSH